MANSAPNSVTKMRGKLILAITIATLITAFIMFLVWLGERAGIWMLSTSLPNSPLFSTNPLESIVAIGIYVWIMSFAFAWILLALIINRRGRTVVQA